MKILDICVFVHLCSICMLLLLACVCVWACVRTLYLDHASIVIIVPVEVEVFNANTGGVGAGQQDCGAIHCFN